MFANLLWAGLLMLQGQGNEVGWDLVSMWHNMGWPAKTAHISGTVVLHAIIGTDGTVQDLQYISGPPLLMRSAMDAVHQWRYKPTMLNGEPVEVDTTVQVVFTLGG